MNHSMNTMSDTIEQPAIDSCKGYEETATHLRVYGEEHPRGSLSDTNSCESSYSFHEEVEGLLFQSPLYNNWQGRNETLHSSCTENASDSKVRREQARLEFWYTSGYQSGFDSYSQEEDFSKSFSVENHVVCPDLNNVEMKRQCYPMEDYDEESVEINLGSSTYNGTDISSIYKYMQQRDEASLLLTRDRNSMYPSNFLSYSFATEGHSNRSQSSCNKDNVEKNSFKTCKEIVKEVPWTQCDEYLQECHDLMKANLMQSHLQLPKVSCPLNATRRRKRRKSKASPKDLLEQDASVLYKPTDWSQYELSSYRMAALARYYYKKHRRNYANKVRYECRKRLAVYRPRLYGRFVKASCNTSKSDEPSHDLDNM